MEHRDERIVVETDRYRITGMLRLPRDGYRSRLTDYLNSSERAFVALTDVELVPFDGGEPERRPFLAVSLNHVVLAMPLDGDVGRLSRRRRGRRPRPRSRNPSAAAMYRVEHGHTPSRRPRGPQPQRDPPRFAADVRLARCSRSSRASTGASRRSSSCPTITILLIEGFVHGVGWSAPSTGCPPATCSGR